jgi:exopolysaccharide biosynthesis polyprenyl glycosylphosphotransferase
LFALSDIFLVGLAFLAAYETRVLLPFSNEFFLNPDRKALVLGFSIVAWVAAGLWLNVYEKLDAWRPRVILRDSARQCVYGVASLALLQYAERFDPALSRPFVALFGAFAWFLLAVFRLAAGRSAGAIRRGFAAPTYVMVAGTGERALRMARELERFSDYGVRLVGFLSEGSAGPGRDEIALGSSYKVRPISQLPAILREHVVDEIFFAVESGRLPDMEETFLLCDEEGVRTRVAVDFFPHVNSKVSLDRFGGAPLLTFTAAPDDEIHLLLKRLTDVIVAGVGLLILAPFMAAVVVLIRLTSPGPAIFRQVRCGLSGRRFVFYKFRSMCQNAEDLKPALEHLSTRETAFKIPDDPRLTPLGRYLRKFSIDEWPQLWSVLRGDMSLVGPRPAVPGEVEQYKRWQRRRLRMRPGLTCTWVISGRDSVDFETWMKMDLEYIDNWSLALDWKILMRTIPRVLTGRGAN